jgi:two-component system phosphate regulon response regulator PhoB
MTANTILLVEDESAIREMVSMALERAEFSVVQASSASEAEKRLADGLPDLIVMDWMMPGVSGIELARRLRRDDYTRQVPIIMLTARGEEDDRIRGLDAGADDYVTKPFSPRELIARIRAVLRRTIPSSEDDIIEVGKVRLDLASHRVTAGEGVVEMGPTEFKLLHFFMTHTERVYSRTQLLDMVWGRGAYVEERTVDVHIRRLRKALEPFACDDYVQTVRGTGYRFSQQG